MRIRILESFTVISALIMLLCLPSNLYAAGTATVTAVGPAQAIYAGEQFTVSITLTPNNAIAGAQFSLSFNASLATVNSITEGNLLKSGGANTYFIPGQIDNTAGTVTGVAGAIISPGQTVSTAGTIAVINMTAKNAAGTSPLNLSNVIVGDSSGQPVTSTAVNGQVVIQINRPPVLVAIGNKTVNEGTLLQFSITATDPDGNALTYSVANPPSGANFNNATLTFSWTPGYAQAGTYTAVRFQVSDGSLTDYEDITITVNNVNRAPVLGAIGNKIVDEGSQLQFIVTATDPDGDPLTYSAASLPSGAIFTASTQTFTWTPNYSQSGIYNNIHFQVSDGSFSAGEDIRITVNNVNRAPVLSTIGSKTVDEGATLQFTVSAVDSDNDPLTYSASNLPNGAVFNSSTKSFSWTPNYAQAGTYTAIHIQVSDGSLTAYENISISVNQPYADWDPNADSKTNVLDMIVIGQHWGETGIPGWIRIDANTDGTISVLDCIVIGQHWTG